MSDQTEPTIGSGGSNGFFANIFTEGLGNLFAGIGNLVPIWAADTLNLQQTNLLENPSFVGDVGGFGDFSTLPPEPDRLNVDVPAALGGGTIELNRLLLIGAGIALGAVFLFNR